MSVLGSLTSFVAGAAIGAAGGIIGGRLLAPESGESTKLSLQSRKNQIAAAGEQARVEQQRRLEQQYRDAVASKAARKAS